MPPGAIGSLQLQRGGPLPGFFQPVEIKAPFGALISLAVDGQFDEPQRNLSAPPFGKITNTLNDGRVLQVGLRLIL